MDTTGTHAIDTLDDLRRHLQWAIELEHATIPPYMCALYSLDPERNGEAVHVVGSVLAEEMLHLALAANLLNAVGGRPELDTPRLLPAYPHPLPHGDRSVEVHLAPFGPQALDLFLRIEQPASADAPPQSDQYQTIGQFYAAIEAGIGRLCTELGEAEVFCGDPERQIGAFHLRGGGGQVIAVHDLKSAMAALAEIIEQGEGAARTDVWDGDHDVFHPEREEVAHYYRFQELRLGRRYRTGDTPQSGPTGEQITVDFDGVLPMRHNPRITDYPHDSAIRVAQEEFNHTYSTLLHLLERAFNGSPSLMRVATGMMYALRAQAKALMSMPTGDGQTNAGPTFEYVPPERRHWSTGNSRRITLLENGPYLVYGQIPLRRKKKIVSEEGQSLTWQTHEDIPTEETYALCRCGRSGAKPFCDGSHARPDSEGKPFDGTEAPNMRPYAELQHIHDGEGISAHRVGELCIHAAFCIGRTRPIAKMLDDSGDPDVRSHIMGLIDHCPSGSYAYSLSRDTETIEADLQPAISVLEEENGLASALWVTGRVPVERSDGQPVEARNRMTLCRCGHSSNKPLCDGTHRQIGFHE
ncbi:CDGSH-type Zn-finger protein [Kibdelosporangium banguiense]|uniref:CDGSH-type Zn-finger protein n=1 Tax=Kibdelosporangium banguiense TaxID=1365924 RepID=A0ABS4TQB9_9PSEU|nr:ferritin-like domain-containing protein [Kibdelosporangium banguiense]MBP2326610.1 CDGSH-type Zn-finger protein [Kibdelosporangium banguiense]